MVQHHPSFTWVKEDTKYWQESSFRAPQLHKCCEKHLWRVLKTLFSLPLTRLCPNHLKILEVKSQNHSTLKHLSRIRSMEKFKKMKKNMGTNMYHKCSTYGIFTYIYHKNGVPTSRFMMCSAECPPRHSRVRSPGVHSRVSWATSPRTNKASRALRRYRPKPWGHSKAIAALNERPEKSIRWNFVPVGCIKKMCEELVWRKKVKSFGYPSHPCLVYLPTFTIKIQPHVFSRNASWWFQPIWKILVHPEWVWILWVVKKWCFFKFLDRNAGAFFGVTSRATVRGCLVGSDSKYYSLSVSL